MATIGEKLCVELSQCLSQHGYSPFAADRKGPLRGQISAIMQPDNTVRKLMGKKRSGGGRGGVDYLCFFVVDAFPLLSESRVQNYLLASLKSTQHKTPPPLPGGLAPVAREVKELAVRFSRLVNFNKLVFSPFYQKILQKLLTAGESPSAGT